MIKDYLVLNYSEDPGPRYHTQGDHSGEDFYHEILNDLFYNVLQEKMSLRINLDGASGYASSFLDEAFGNLIYDFGLELVRDNLIIVSKEEPEWISMIRDDTFKEWETRRSKGDEPTKTKLHKAWYRYTNSDFERKIWIEKYVD